MLYTEDGNTFCNMKDKFIDVEKIILDKNKTFFNVAPAFLLNYIKKVTHEDEINFILDKCHGQYKDDFAHCIVKHFNVKASFSGLEKIPAEGSVILVSNHPWGFMESMALIRAIYPIRPDIKFIANDIFLNIEGLRDLLVGINRHGTKSFESLKQVSQAFSHGQAVFIYPAGLVSRKSNGQVKDLPWTKTFVTQSKKSNIPVIPIHISGQLSNFFYQFSNLRKMIGIKKNIEIFYLANEQFKLKDKALEVTVGDVISPVAFDKSKSDMEWAQWTKEKVYSLHGKR